MGLTARLRWQSLRAHAVPRRQVGALAGDEEAGEDFVAGVVAVLDEAEAGGEFGDEEGFAPLASSLKMRQRVQAIDLFARHPRLPP